MEKAKIYFTDFKVEPYGKNVIEKLKTIVNEAGLKDMDLDGKFVAIKMHFGEKGNLAFLRPNYARAIVDMVYEKGGKPFLTDCNTMYPGFRKNAIEHLYCAWENGFTPLSVNCPIIIGDGLKGTDDVEVPVKNGEYVEKAKIGRAIMDADVIISLAHFKGHENAAIGGAIKNIGMGCGSRAGKKEQHSGGKPFIKERKCRGCKMCQRECANNGLVFDEEKRKMTVDLNSCVGCGRCLGACNFDAIDFECDDATEILNYKMAEYTKAVVDGREVLYINIVNNVSPFCDCHSENDISIIPDVGMFAGRDPVAIDQACVDACKKQTPVKGSILAENLQKAGFTDMGDPFVNTSPNTKWLPALTHGEKIGLGTRDYELITM